MREAVDPTCHLPCRSLLEGNARTFWACRSIWKRALIPEFDAWSLWNSPMKKRPPEMVFPIQPVRTGFLRLLSDRTCQIPVWKYLERIHKAYLGFPFSLPFLPSFQTSVFWLKYGVGTDVKLISFTHRVTSGAELAVFWWEYFRGMRFPKHCEDTISVLFWFFLNKPQF